MQGHEGAEGRALPRLALDGEPSAVAQHDVLDDGEPEPRTADLAADRGIDAVEALRQPRQVFRRDARPSETRLNQLDAPGTVDLDRLYRIVDVLLDIGGQRGVSAAQVALNWVMNKPGVDTVVIGARNEEQLRDNLAAAGWQLTVEEMARLDEVSAVKLGTPHEDAAAALSHGIDGDRTLLVPPPVPVI